MKKYSKVLVLLGIIFIPTKSMSLMQCTKSASEKESNDPIADNAKKMLAEGKQTFRFKTFCDEAYWTDALHLNNAIAGEKNGGIGPGLSPIAAIAAGLKVDLDAIPA